MATTAPEVAGGVGRRDAKRFGVCCLWAVVGVAAMAAGLQLGDGSGAAKSLSDLSYVLVPGIAGLACLRRANSRPEDRAAWRWIGCSCLLWAAGGAVWGFYGVTRDHHYPFPSAADIGFLGYSLPAAVGLWRLRSRASAGRPWLWELLDAAVISGAVLFVSWAGVLGDLYDSPAPSQVERVVGLAYPVVDVVMRRF